MELIGQVRHRRKLTKQLFFIDIQPLDQSEKSQIFFRNDDDSLDFFAVQEAYKQCKPGQIIQVTVIPPLAPSEQENKDYKVWQSVCPVKVIEPYVSDKPFVQDRPLAASKENTDNTGLQTNKSTVCKYWVNKNTCIKGDDCPFRHPTGHELIKERQTWIEERTKNRLRATHDPNDPHTSNKQPHALRAFIFADWIRRTFEQELTGSGAVLDIAAGKGEISMFLSRAFGIPSVAIEPQERKRTNYWYIKLRRLMYRYEIGSLERPDWENKQIMIDFEHWPSPIVPQYMHAYFDETFLREHHDLVSDASLFIGLHPDQATMPIVDMAIKMRKPFAVVPCCVFSQENQTRRLKTGKVVMTTEQLIQYICEKDIPSGEIKTDYLPFEGKNRVVYWKP
ncbi:hypothetical protein G6F70_005198 [Rhizopus microsporus]|uniref:C3H1-type domain-containing protein n=2 Tax=Rhizopus TaxID=4842 RepID=A0A367K7A9_RHIAZ|nr:hypothetical protein G6F71_002967 [Rhizopus microsporus]RCH98019.1 hypothetical protein CU097_013984 [Rhizopus azygosporus]KAG1199119.1 hypothetical protein G6F70_005198 [Rhizopus microsporus]KAG1210946.1 hypothetical protein G6F69_005017 [Rhizopus microsporus]KAG1232785.1 hypothetical protein G6F67_004750 [Rhizopus microsporus]